MDFSLTPEQEAIVETARRFAQNELAPGYAARDRSGKLERHLVAAMGRLGLLGIEHPEKFGGLGGDHVTAGLALEAIAVGDFSFGYVCIMCSLGGQIIAQHAAPEVAEEWLPKLISGEKIVGIGLTEPRGGSDAAQLQLKARREGDHYVLSGEKTSISFATQADVVCLFVRTGSADSGAKGITALLVPLDLPGITRTDFDDVGTRGVGRGSLFFDEVKVPVINRLGAENQGFGPVMQGFDYSRALIGLECVAIAQQSVTESWAYATERKAFGKPLSAFQGVSFPLAEAETQLHACRLMCLQTLWLKDQNLPHTSEAAMCKWWGPKLAFDVIHACLLTHGHGGYSKELPFQQRLRDVMGFEIGDGMAQIMKLIIARQKVGRQAVPA
ncbi:MAG: cyclohexanecarboxyl-CoA dehydrogenase [Rhodocyclaceae bacterium]|nr:cyclohexanecarboxyl-CoA dehydrogenase [Rhodocyclaceae bacterium]